MARIVISESMDAPAVAAIQRGQAIEERLRVGRRAEQLQAGQYPRDPAQVVAGWARTAVSGGGSKKGKK